MLGPDAPRRLDLAVGDESHGHRRRLRSRRFLRGAVKRRVGEWTFEHDARAFFQAHAGLIGDLQREVCGRARGELAVDLYAGVGLFALPLARRYGRVIAVESDRVAARFAARNARANGCGNVEMRAGVGGELGALDAEVGRPGGGRSAAHRAAAPAAARADRDARAAPHLRVVPSGDARARPARPRVEYSIVRLTLLDMFPQTGHIEMVVDLVPTATPVGAAPRATGAR